MDNPLFLCNLDESFSGFDRIDNPAHDVAQLIVKKHYPSFLFLSFLKNDWRANNPFRGEINVWARK